ncbi:hypothetical protein BKA69DRAFT_614714 [Paraphysoderma sedebokerense]|nr:hypothetical protein BKA69DRAFT_614714 [Paraphysoderma sedebokerense]
MKLELAFLRYFLLGIGLLVVLNVAIAQTVTTSPYFLRSSYQFNLTASDTVILESEINATHVTLLDSSFRLHTVGYALPEVTQSHTTVSVSAALSPIFSGNWSLSRVDATVAMKVLGNGIVAIASYPYVCNGRNLLAVSFLNGVTGASVSNIFVDPCTSADLWASTCRSRAFDVLYKNPRIKILQQDASTIFVGLYNQATVGAPSSYYVVARISSTGVNGYRLTHTNSGGSANAIVFSCNGPQICIWESQTAGSILSMDTLGRLSGFSSTSGVGFDPAFVSLDQESAYMYLQPNDSSSFVFYRRSLNGTEVTRRIPYTINYPHIGNTHMTTWGFPVQLRTHVHAGFTTRLNSSLGLNTANTDIVLGMFSTSAGEHPSRAIFSTVGTDILSSFIHHQNGSYLLAGTTDGNIQSTTATSARSAFLAYMQRFAMTAFQSSTPTPLRISSPREFCFSINTTDLAGLPTVLAGGRTCDTVRRQNNNPHWYCATPPAGVGNVEIIATWDTLPHRPSVSWPLSLPVRYDDPVITAASPTTGSIAGFNINITATNLGLAGVDPVSVMIGNLSCQNVVQLSANLISCRVPQGANLGTAAVVVTTAPGINSSSSSNVSLTYASPILTSVSPAVLTSNSIFIIRGQNFGDCQTISPCNSSSVRINVGSNQCGSVQLHNSTHIECIMPVGSGTVNVSVTVLNWTTSNLQVSYELPVMTSLSPSVTNRLDPVINITGTGFGPSWSARRVSLVEAVSGSFRSDCDSVVWINTSLLQCIFQNTLLPTFTRFNVSVIVEGLTSANQGNITQLYTNNALPQAFADSLRVRPALPTVINLDVRDREDTVSVVLLSLPSHGTLHHWNSSAPGNIGQPIRTVPATVNQALILIANSTFQGADAFNFRARDSYGQESPVVSFPLSANTVPSFANQDYTINEDETLAILYPRDLEDDAIGIRIITYPPQSAASLDLTSSGPSCSTLFLPNFTVVPVKDYFGAFEFTVQTTDEVVNCTNVNAIQHWSNTQIIRVVVNPVNDLPIAQNGSISVNEDTPVSVTFNITDVDNPVFLVRLDSIPALSDVSIMLPNGTRALANNVTLISNESINVIPRANFHGAIRISFVASDTLDPNSATWSLPAFVDITFIPVNDLPSAFNTNIDIAEDESRILQFNATDVDGDTLFFYIKTLPNPAHARLFWSNDSTKLAQIGHIVHQGGVRILPTQDFNGIVSFTYKVTDFVNGSSTHWSTPMTYSIEYRPENDNVQVSNSSVVTDEDMPLTITFNVVDVDGDPVVVRVKTLPPPGAASLHFANSSNVTVQAMHLITGNTVRLVPKPNYNGDFVFEFDATDSFTGATTTWSHTSYIHVKVRPVNDIPIASNTTYTQEEDTIIVASFGVTDPDNWPVAVRIRTLPPTSIARVALTNGTAVTQNMLLQSTDTIRIIPVVNHNGVFSIGFDASDNVTSGIWSNTSYINVRFNPVNDLPIAFNSTIAQDEDTTIVASFNVSDPDNSPVTVSIRTLPPYSVARVFRANGSILTEGDILLSTDTITVIPAPDYNGQFSVGFDASDDVTSNFWSDIAYINIRYNPVNDPPVTFNSTVSGDEDTTMSVSFNVTDVDNWPVSVRIRTLPPTSTIRAVRANGSSLTEGTILLSTDVITLIPALNYYGHVSIGFDASDNTTANIWSTISYINVNYKPVNDIPVAVNSTVTVQEDASITIPLNINDVENDPLGVQIVSLPPSGTAKLILSTTGEELKVGSYINLTLSSVILQPAENYHGHFNFAFEATDAFIGSNTLWSNTAAVVVTVTSVNDLPSAFDTSVDNAEDESRVLQFNASDIDGDSLYFKIHTTPINTQASLVWSNDTTKLVKPGDIVPQGGVRIQPVANFHGKISFRYSVTDFLNATSTYWSDAFFYNIEYKPQNDEVEVYNSTYIVNEDTTFTINFNVTDVDDDGPIVIRLKSLPAHNAARLHFTNSSNSSPQVMDLITDNTLRVVPMPNYNGEFIVEFDATDSFTGVSTLWSPTAYIHVKYTPVNDVPVTHNSSYEVNEDNVLSEMLITGQ